MSACCFHERNAVDVFRLIYTLLMSNLGLVISRLIIFGSNKDINTCIEIKLAVEIKLCPVNFIITTTFSEIK